MRSAIKRSRFSSSVSRSCCWRQLARTAVSGSKRGGGQLVFLHQQFGRLRAHQRRATRLELQQYPVVSAACYSQLRHDLPLVPANRQTVLIDSYGSPSQRQACNHAFDLFPHLLHHGRISRQTLSPKRGQFLASNRCTQRPHVCRRVDDWEIEELSFPGACWRCIHTADHLAPAPAQSPRRVGRVLCTCSIIGQFCRCITRVNVDRTASCPFRE